MFVMYVKNVMYVMFVTYVMYIMCLMYSMYVMYVCNCKNCVHNCEASLDKIDSLTDLHCFRKLQMPQPKPLKIPTIRSDKITFSPFWNEQIHPWPVDLNIFYSSHLLRDAPGSWFSRLLRNTLFAVFLNQWDCSFQEISSWQSSCVSRYEDQ